MTRTLLTVLLAAWLLALPGEACADTVYLKSGKKLRGNIVKQDADKVMIETRYGTQTIEWADIDRIEQGKSEREEYEERKAKIGEKDAQAHYQLGLWCKENRLSTQARAEFEAAIEIDPGHDGARKELGYEKHKGQWLTHDEVMEKKGFKKWQGQWVSAQEYDRLLKKKIQQEKGQKEATKEAEEVRKALEAARKEYEGVPWEQRHKIERKKKNKYHFVLECNSTREMAQKYAKLMEWLYEKYMKIFKVFKPEYRKVNIFIYRNHKEFMQMTRRPGGVRGFYDAGKYRLATFHGTFGSTSNTCTVLAHEGTHLFQDLIGMFGQPIRCPVWLAEGMAVLLEAAEVNWRTGKIRIKGVSRERLVRLQRELSGSRALTLKHVLDRPKDKFSARYYAYAGMFTYWLLMVKKGKYALLYNDYVKIATGWRPTGQRSRMIRKGDFENLVQKYFNRSLSDLEKDWKKWVLKQKPEKLVRKKGNRYVSEKLNFTVSRPSTRWKAATEKQGMLVFFDSRRLGARITVSARGNFWNHTLASLVNLVKKSHSDAVSNGRLTDYKLISEKFDNTGGHKAYDLVWLARDPRSPFSKELMKRRYVYLVTPDNYYWITLTAPPDRYHECLEDFEKVLESFEIHM